MKKYRYMEFVPLLRELIVNQVECVNRPLTYVEVGVQRGFTFKQIAPMLDREGNPAIRLAVGVDLLDPPANLPANCRFFKMPSQEFAQIWKGEIDVMLIDADHRREAVMGDFECLSPFINDTGLIFMHDTYPTHEGLLSDSFCSSAWQAAWKIHKERPDWQIITLPGPWAGLSILKRGIRPLHWMDDEQTERHLQGWLFQAEVQDELAGARDGGGDPEAPESEERPRRGLRDRRSRK